MKNQMRNKELVVSLNKLLILQQQGPQSITLSVFANHQEHFIQNQKIVRGNKVSFFRQCLFVNPEDGIELRIYALEQNTKSLAHVFQIQPSELNQVGARPTAFQARSSDFVLLWEGWMFKQDSSSYPISQKDYSQLQMPLQQCSQPSLSSSHSQHSKLIHNYSKKRSSSTQNSLQQSEQSPSPRNTSTMGCGELPIRGRKLHLRSHICSQILTEISSMLSSTKV